MFVQALQGKPPWPTGSSEACWLRPTPLHLSHGEEHRVGTETQSVLENHFSARESPHPHLELCGKTWLVLGHPGAPPVKE